MQVEEKRNWLIRIFYFLTIFLLGFFLIQLLITKFLPFLLGFIIALFLQPWIRFCESHLPFSRKCITIGTLLVFYLCFVVFCYVFGSWLYRVVSQMLAQLPALLSSQAMLQIQASLMQLQNIEIPFLADVDVAYLWTQFSTQLIQMTSNILPKATSFLSIFPAFLFQLILMILASIFFSLDFSFLQQFLALQCSPATLTKISKTKQIFYASVRAYLSAYFKLFLLTFLELSIGLSILQVEHAIVIALFIACFDIFPVLGTGMILYPWILILFLLQQKKLAVGLIILHLSINLIRQIAEPKIVGKQLGIPAIVLFLSLILTTHYFGILALFVTPLILSIIQQLHRFGILHWYRITP